MFDMNKGVNMKNQTNQQVIDNFNKWQKSGKGHPYTCNTHSQTDLIAIERNGKVIFICPIRDCIFKQNIDPEMLVLIEKINEDSQ